MKGITNKQIELARQSILEEGLYFGIPEWDYPNSAAAAEQLEVWELTMWRYCEYLISGFGSTGDEALKTWAAGLIGDLIAEQLIAGNFSAPRIVSEGLINIQAGASWRRHAGVSGSPLRHLVLLAFCCLQWDSGGKPVSVSQSDVRNFISKHGLDLSRDCISKYFDKLKLNEHKGDARKASNRKGK